MLSSWPLKIWGEGRGSDTRRSQNSNRHPQLQQSNDVHEGSRVMLTSIELSDGRWAVMQEH